MYNTIYIPILSHTLTVVAKLRNNYILYLVVNRKPFEAEAMSFFGINPSRHYMMGETYLTEV